MKTNKLNSYLTFPTDNCRALDRSFELLRFLVIRENNLHVPALAYFPCLHAFVGHFAPPRHSSHEHGYFSRSSGVMSSMKTHSIPPSSAVPVRSFGGSQGGR